MSYILLYGDDIILVTSSDTLHQIIMSTLGSKFSKKDFGHLGYFLGIYVIRNTIVLFLF